MEDRSWWKESLVAEEGMTETEAARRPRVYESVKVNTPVSVISEQYVHKVLTFSYVLIRLFREAAKYLPRQDGSSSEPSQASIKCYFGPPSKGVMRELKMFDSFDISKSGYSLSFRSCQ